MAHTPEPWYRGKTVEDDLGIKSISVGPFKADVHYESTIAEVYDENHDAEENVKLICAAPMLARLIPPMGEFTKRNPTAHKAWIEEYEQWYKDVQDLMSGNWEDGN